MLVLLVIAYLRVADRHDEARPLIAGLVSAFVIMTVIAHIFS